MTAFHSAKYTLGPSRTRGQFQICSGQIRLEIGQWQNICPESYSRTSEQNLWTKHNTMLVSAFLDSRLSNWSCFSAHSWTKSFSSSLLHLSRAFLFSADEDARREEDGVDVGIELSSLNWRDSGNESVLVVEGDRLGFPRSLNMDPSSVDIVDIRTEKIGRPRRDSCSGSQHRRPRRSMCHWMNILISTWTN